jgi:hypothetical protein
MKWGLPSGGASSGTFSSGCHVWSNVSKSRWGAFYYVEWNPTIDDATILLEGAWYGDRIQCHTCALSKARGIWGNIDGRKGGKLGWHGKNL